MKDLSKLEHIVVLQLENRSFDHVFGGLAREELTSGRKTTVDVDFSFVNRDLEGKPYTLQPMDDDAAGVFSTDPGHSISSVHRQIAGGEMSGFVRAFQDSHPNSPPDLVMRYLQRRHQPVTYFFADEYTVLRRYFSSIATGTLPNRYYGLAGQSGGVTDNGLLRGFALDLAHIFRGLKARDWAVYSGAFPTIALIGAVGELVKFRNNFHRIKTFLAHARAGELPRLSWIEPVYSWSSNWVLRRFRVPEGPPNDDHPPSHTARGQQLLFDVYDALRSHPKWDRTLFIVNYDEHGGFADHVRPPRIRNVAQDKIEWMGPRVPAMLISPFAARGGRVDTQFDHCSVLRFLCDAFGVAPLGRAALDDTTSIADALLDEPRAEPCPQHAAAAPPQPRAWSETPEGVLGPMVADYLEALEREEPGTAQALREALNPEPAPPERHALLIGSQILGLQAVHNDVAAMDRVLTARGFKTTVLTEGKASRDGILDAYEALIGRARKDDAVVVYYSGHGGYAESPAKRVLQFILPTDWTTADDFRGITDAELSDLQARLTEVTRNVTVILDCCHSSLISRGEPAAPPAGVVMRVQKTPWTRSIEEHVARNTPARVYVAGNPHAVRLVATEADREAFEGASPAGDALVRRGFFTYYLEQVLAEAGADALSWQGVLDRVAPQVTARAQTQRPTVEGPADRVLFGTAVLKRPDAVVYADVDGQPVLRVTAITGAQVGDQFTIVRRGAVDVTPEATIATATIDALAVGGATVTLSDVKEQPQVGSLAFPRRAPFPPIKVAMIGDDAALRASLVQPGSMVELVDVERARFVIEPGADRIAWTDRAERPFLRFEQAVVDARTVIPDHLRRWAKAEALRGLQAFGLPEGAVDVGHGVVVGGKPIAKAKGEALAVGDAIYVQAKNSWDRLLYMWIFDIGINGKVALLSVAPEGRRIEPGHALTLGGDDGRWNGLGMSWPREVDKAIGARRETLVVLASDAEADVRGFLSPDVIFRDVAAKGAESPLAQHLRALGGGRTRDVAPAPVLQQYRAWTIDFDFLPARPA